jgi:hypothetical protein
MQKCELCTDNQSECALYDSVSCNILQQYEHYMQIVCMLCSTINSAQSSHRSNSTCIAVAVVAAVAVLVASACRVLFLLPSLLLPLLPPPLSQHHDCCCLSLYAVVRSDSLMSELIHICRCSQYASARLTCCCIQLCVYTPLVLSSNSQITSTDLHARITCYLDALTYLSVVSAHTVLTAYQCISSFVCVRVRPSSMSS